MPLRSARVCVLVHNKVSFIKPYLYKPLYTWYFYRLLTVILKLWCCELLRCLLLRATCFGIMKFNTVREGNTVSEKLFIFINAVFDRKRNLYFATKVVIVTLKHFASNIWDTHFSTDLGDKVLRPGICVANIALFWLLLNTHQNSCTRASVLF
jgi:hypothetical protein